MNTRKLLGGVLFGASIIGLVASLVGVVLVVTQANRAASEIESVLGTTIDTIETTQDALTLADDALGETADAISALEATTLGVGGTVRSTDTLLGSLGDLFGSDLPTIIIGTQQSLEAAEESAAVIDGVLVGLSSVPLFGIDYDPEVPLGESVQTIRTGLSGLPGTFIAISDDLEDTQETLRDVDLGLGELAASLGEIEETLRESQDLVADYQTLLSELLALTTLINDRVPRWLRFGSYGAAFVLVWLALAQIGLLYQAREMMAGAAEDVLAERITELEARIAKLEGGEAAEEPAALTEADVEPDNEDEPDSTS